MGTNTTANAAADTRAWRSNKTARTGADSRRPFASTKSGGASGNAANKSDYTAGKYGHPASDSIANTTGRYSTRGIN